MMTTQRLCIALTALLLAPLGAVHAAETIDELDERLRIVERKLSGEALTDMVNNLRDTRESVDKLRGQLESIQRRLDDLEERRRKMYGELDQRIRALETEPAEQGTNQSEKSDQSGSDQSGDANETSNKPSEAARNAGAEQQYNQAFKTLRSGNYETARQQFKTLLDDHPNSGFSDNARYWIGESHYVVREFDKARDAFQTVLDEHPDSPKRSDALLKIGFIDYEEGDQEAARDTLNQVIERYPDTSVAEQAQKRLERMER